MRQIGLGGLLALVLLAFGVGGGAAAAEEYGPPGLPEVGHCVQVMAHTGEYVGSKCLESAAGNGYFDWHAATKEEKLGFSGLGGVTTLTTENEPSETLTCGAFKVSGEWEGPKTASTHITLTGCTNELGSPCQSSTTSGEIVSGTLPAELGFIKNTTKEGKLVVQVGLDFRPEPLSGDLFTYSCASILEQSKVEGSLIGQIKPIDTMTGTSKLQIQVKKGHQGIEKFEGEPKDTLTTSLMSGLSTISAPTLFNIAPKTETGTNSPGKYEIKAELK